MVEEEDSEGIAISFDGWREKVAKSAVAILLDRRLELSPTDDLLLKNAADKLPYQEVKDESDEDVGVPNACWKFSFGNSKFEGLGLSISC